ncbi:hypothetical protein ACFLQL_04575 [Verrucomicrobiota bacterium]
MKKITALFICSLFVSALVLAQEAAAPAAAPAADAKTAEAPKLIPLELRKTGYVNVIKDASGKVTAIKLVVTSYDIEMDEGSKPLEEMDGQKVRVNCTLSHADGKRLLTIKNVEQVAGSGGAPAAPAAAKPAEAPAAK